MNLLWTKTKRQRFVRGMLLDINTGCNCLFLHLTQRTGIKIYFRKRDRDIAYNMQKKAHKLGFGPAVGDKIDLKHKNELHALYEYLDITMPPEWRHNCEKPHFYGYVTEAVCIPPEGLSAESFRDLHKRMKDARFSTWDMTEKCNIGLRNGKPVCIDFDPISMGLMGLRTSR